MKLRLWWVPLLLLAAPLVGRVPAHRDLLDYFAPMRVFTAQALARGEVPWFNPLNGCGEAWFANPQTGVLYPPHWLYLILPVDWGLSAEIGLHLAWLSLGMGLLARRDGADHVGRSVVEVAAWSAGPILSMVGMVNNLAALAWLPWMLLAALRREKVLVPCGLAVALGWLSGEPLVWALGVAAMLTVAVHRRRVLAGIALGTALVAVQLVPFLVWIGEGDRGPASALSPDRGAVPPGGMLDLLVPGRLSEASHWPWAESLYLGAPLALLVLLGARARWRLMAPSLMLIALSLLPAVGGGGIFMAATGGFVRYPSRLAVLALVLVVPLAGRGARRFLLGAAGPLAPALGALTVALGLIAGGWTGLTAVVAGAALLAAAALPHRQWLRPAAVVVGLGSCVVAGFPLLGLAPRVDTLQPVSPWPPVSGRIYAPQPAGDRLHTAVRSPGGREEWLLGYLNLRTGHTATRSYAPVLNERMANHLARADEGPAGRWWMDALAAEWAVLPPSLALEGLEPVAQHGDSVLYRNLRSLPLVAHASEVPREGWRPGTAASHLQIDAASLTAVVVAPEPGWLWIAVAPVAGWRWNLDGQQVILQQGPGLLQFLQVSAGSHRLAGRYRPPLLLTASFISFGAALCLLFFARPRSSQLPGKAAGGAVR